MSDVVGTAKTSLWLGMSDETVRHLCREGKLKRAFQPAGYQGKWLISREVLAAKRARPRMVKRVTE